MRGSQRGFYKAGWNWKGCSLTLLETSEHIPINKTRPKGKYGQDRKRKTSIFFSENIGQNALILFKSVYQRQVKPNNIPDVVTIQDIKDVVAFLAVGIVPRNLVALLHSYEINAFLKTLIVYFQIYLQVSSTTIGLF